MRAPIFGLLAAVLAFGSFPAAAQSEVIDSFTGEELKALFEQEGIELSLETDEVGHPFLRGRFEGAEFVIFTSDCEEAYVPRCETLSFTTGWRIETPLRAVDYVLVDRYNSENLFGQAWIDEEDASLNVAYTHEVSGGVTARNIRKMYGTFIDTIMPVFYEGVVAEADRLRLDSARAMTSSFERPARDFGRTGLAHAGAKMHMVPTAVRQARNSLD